MLIENTPSLETERLLLRRFVAEDVQALYALLSDEETNAFLPWFPLTSLREAEAFLQTHFLDHYARPTAYRYAVCPKGEPHPIGYVWLGDPPANDFGYALRREYWRRGLATEAARAVMERIRRAGYPYVTATHDVNNPRSGEVMRKLGMVYRYSYVEQWQPKDRTVIFRMYQANFDGCEERVYREYWERYPQHFVEAGV